MQWIINEGVCNHWCVFTTAVLLVIGFASAASGQASEEPASEKTYTEHECNKKFAGNLNGVTWELLDKENRTQEEDIRMINAAHASCYHWYVVGTDTNQQIGHWLISHVYAVLNRPEPALYHAQICMNLTDTLNLQDWYRAYAYEALARAYAAAGQKEQAMNYIGLAEEVGKTIREPEDKKLWEGDFAKGPWYNMK